MDAQESNELVTGGPGTLTIGDRVYLVGQPAESDMRTLKYHLRKQVKSPLAAIKDELAGLDPLMRSEVIAAAVRMQSNPTELTPDMIVELLIDPKNAAFIVWLLSRKLDPTLKLESVIEVIDESNVLYVLDALYEASGLAAVVAGKVGGTAG